MDEKLQNPDTMDSSLPPADRSGEDQIMSLQGSAPNDQPDNHIVGEKE